MKKLFLIFMLAYSQSFSIFEDIFTGLITGGVIKGARLIRENNENSENEDMIERKRENKIESQKNKRALYQAGNIINRLVNTSRRAHNTLFDIDDYKEFDIYYYIELNIKERANRAQKNHKKSIAKKRSKKEDDEGKIEAYKRFRESVEYISNELSGFERALIRARFDNAYYERALERLINDD